jgi:hypothetical protein
LIRRADDRSAKRRDGRRAAARGFVCVAIVVLGSLAVAACGSVTSPSPRVLPDPIASSTAASPRASADTASASASTSRSPGASPGDGSAVRVDPSLLSFLPIGGNGLIQAVDPDTTAQIAQDPALRASASALIIATYLPAPTSASAPPAEDFAVVSVIRLRDPNADEAWFRDWRDSYDAAVCANAGGVSRNSQTNMGTHTVYVASCAGGSFTYHTRIADGAIVISINSIGPANLGRTVMERLSP